MNVNRKNNLIVSCFIAAIVVMIVALGTGCSTPSGGSPVEGQFFLLGHDVNDRPPVFTHWDSDLFVWWTDATGVARVRAAASKVPIYEETIEANKAGAKLRSKDLKWSGVPGQPMPLWVKGAFTDSEIAAWGLTFIADP